MRLDPDSALLHYRLVERIGRGGMGEVWRARDLKLDREVAIKILPADFVVQPDRLARFEREARLLARLNHPGIVTIHSVERQDDCRFIVMELVTGKTLAEGIPEGGLPADRFFSIGFALADALAAAHRQGVTHRDIKPGNIMVDSEGRVKVLDFGLARPQEPAADASEAKTSPPDLTREGVMLGTAAWMSPEQAEGKHVDARTDIFSLGAVLYTMATGRHPFGGGSLARIMASILDQTPPAISSVRSGLPHGLDALVAQCLEKAPERRPESAIVLRDRLEALAADAGARGARRSFRRGVTIAAVSGVVLLGLALAWMLRPGAPVKETPASGAAGPGPAARHLTQATLGEAIEQWPAWSPSGDGFLFCAEVDGSWKIHMKDLDGGDRPITTGPGDDIQPTWSPDGARLAFVRARDPGTRLRPGDVLSGTYSGGDLWIQDIPGGEARRVVEEAFHPAFSPDGNRLAMDASWAGPRRIWVTDARGRNPRQISTDVSEAVSHTGPSWSPDGTHIVFQNMENTKSDLRIVDVATGGTTNLTDDAFQDLMPAWSRSGAFIYFTSDRGGGLNIWRFRVTPEGRASEPPEQLTTGAGRDIQPAPAGTRLAFTVLQQNADLWRIPVDPATGMPAGPAEPLVVTTREESRGAWSPDGRRVAFNSDRDGEMNIWIHEIGGAARRLTSGPGGDYQPRWSPDGKSIVFFSARSGNLDLWIADVESGALRRLTDDPVIEINPSWSPDGKWVAFASDRDGRLEGWVLGADGGGTRRVTEEGVSVHYLTWSDDSRSLIFASGQGAPRRILRRSIDGGPAERIADVSSGAHISFSPDRRLILDVEGHRTIWVYPVDGAERKRVFAFDDPETRIDYPFWSPDGKWVLFDRVSPRGGDVWVLDPVE